MAARARRVRAPRDAGLVRRAGWFIWRGVSTVFRPAVFGALVMASGLAAFAGLQQLDTGTAAQDRAARISAALAALAADAPAAASLWEREIEAALRPRRSGPPDTELALSLAHAFEDVAGRERYASFAWGEGRGLDPYRTEAALRALPVWVRAGELERVWQQALGTRSTLPDTPASLELAPRSVRARLSRARHLYPLLDQASTGFFSGHETGAFNLASLPGNGLAGEAWLLADAPARARHCADGKTLPCALAEIGLSAGQAGLTLAAGQGARLMRAGLAAGRVSAELAEDLALLDRRELEVIARDVALTAQLTSNAAAIRLIAHAGDTRDIARLRQIAQSAGPRTLAVFHLIGSDALDLAGAVDGTPSLTRPALEYFIVAALILLLAFGMVASAIISAARVRSSRRAGLGQRLDIAARELLLGRKV
ncbi:MAG: hypothetical protein JJU26_12030 [Oceanicaulis sp.]|uniref:hypothetical protein n=1 Tax=Glycocaulis sp. TaxID=1969725 RepID=UPI0025B80E09|nr:hypothetical protein [Glycocaulis sp.]MCC5982433.1 hypothetical protein [Oceanicaulis sp.]MCH8521262.1 hypothetical protein [Glycocaulis sp.]